MASAWTALKMSLEIPVKRRGHATSTLVRKSSNGAPVRSATSTWQAGAGFLAAAPARQRAHGQTNARNVHMTQSSYLDSPPEFEARRFGILRGRKSKPRSKKKKTLARRNPGTGNNDRESAEGRTSHSNDARAVAVRPSTQQAALASTRTGYAGTRQGHGTLASTPTGPTHARMFWPEAAHAHTERCAGATAHRHGEEAR